MAYKRELIINNGSLTSYKKLLKVSDVCQLLDKSKYPATRTTNGITFTNNGDGTITANGTATKRAQFYLNDTPVVEGHTYFLTGVAGSTSAYFLNSYFLSSTGWLKDNICYGTMPGVIYSYVPGALRARNYIAIDPRATANNLVFKPQLFDLTEMYGAGNEPKTVAEFKAKFPNEMYDYSPRCWVTSYKTGLIAKTKNLFNSNNIDTQWLGISYKTVANGKILLNGAKETGANIFSVTRPKITLPAGTYTLSCRMLAGNIEGYDITFNRWIYFSINGSTYTYRCNGVGKVGDYGTKTFTLTEDTLLSSFDITAGYTGGFNIDNVMIECQLEKGSTATNYVPYGYL